VERAEQPFVAQALQDTDRRVGEGKPVAPSFLLACVLWSDVREAWGNRLNQRGQGGRPPTPFGALQDAVDQVFDARIGDVSGRGKLGADMREIWLMQTRFDKRAGSSPFSLAEQPRFRAGFDFLRLRAAVGEVPEELAHWWEAFSMADDAHRNDMVEAVRAETARTRVPAARKPRVHRVEGDQPMAPAPATDATDDPRFRPMDDGSDGMDRGQAADGTDADAPARKRRRRRRKPSGGGNGSGREGGAPAAD
jgi:poly(A) polymerase